MKGLESIDIAAPYVGDKLMVIKQQIWDEAMTYLGIANTNTSKRERLNTSEIYVGMGDVEAQRYTRLMEREIACERINAMFGLNVEVRYRQVIPRMTEEGQEDVDIEVEDEEVEE